MFELTPEQRRELDGPELARAVDPQTNQIGSPVLAVCWLISIPIMQLTAIHPANVTERGLTLKRVSPAFAEALRNYRENRKRQMQQEVGVNSDLITDHYYASIS